MTTANALPAAQWPSIAEAARRLGASCPTTRRLLYRGTLRGWRLPPKGRWKIAPATIEAVLAQAGSPCAP